MPAIILVNPHVDYRVEQPYMGIRTHTPMKGMSKVVDKLFTEMDAWISQAGVQPAGAPILRYYVIDMAGEMDIEVGIPVTAVLPDSGRIHAAVLPAGQYASLVYSGSGIAGNRVLIEWVRKSGLAFDRWDDPNGDAFCARFESFRTDPKVEPRKTKWELEVAIKLADAQ